MTLRMLMLVVPDDHGGMGMDQVGSALVLEDGVITAFWLMDPNTHGFKDITDPLISAWGSPEAGVTMTGNFVTTRALGDWTGYAVTRLDGTLLYQPEGVFRYARKDPELWL